MTLFPNSQAVVIGLPPTFNIHGELISARTIRLATAFAHMTGWDMLSDSISRSSATKYLFTGPSFFQTEPNVLFAWLKLCEQGKSHAAMYSESAMTFHPKVLIVEGSHSFAIVGSGNLSRGGLQGNVECGVYTNDSATVAELCHWFDKLFQRSPCLTPEGVLDYKRKWDKLQAAAKKLREEQAEAENEFVNATRRFFWHNIGNDSNKRDAWAKILEDHGCDLWWNYLVSNGQISASYENKPKDRGENVLRGYEAGDVVIAYASKCGAIGWGVVEKPVYEYVPRDHDAFSETGFHLHRLNGIKWQSCSPTLTSAIPAKELNEKFELKHPRLTKSMVPCEKAHALIAELDRRFGSRPVGDGGQG